MSVDNEMSEEDTVFCFENKSCNLAEEKDNVFGRVRQHVSDFPLDHPPLGHTALALM